ncbi:putative odorant binding protein [Trypoxylus dichotomus]
MYKYRVILSYCICCLISAINSLECGLSSGQNQEELRRYTNACMMKTGMGGDQVIQEDTSIGLSAYDSSYEDDSRPSFEESGVSSTFSKEKTMNSLKEESTTINNSNTNGTMQQNSEDIINNCMIQCVLKQLGLVDPAGYPDHGKISESLLKGAENRELKDFLQDASDECFQMMEHDEHVDACYFSTQLIKCLADKGKDNCSDWPMTDSPFPHFF